MPIQQKTKRLYEYDYRKIIPRDCEIVSLVFQSLPVPRPYWLWRGHHLLRPIMDYSREEKAYEIRKYMTTIAKISAAQAREHLYKQELMKVHNGDLPEDIVEYIARYTWDIHLLL
tara:strand:- start:120 stop:464 length:345 start_codon:yes stop_codon:yes gene_type:complete